MRKYLVLLDNVLVMKNFGNYRNYGLNRILLIWLMDGVEFIRVDNKDGVENDRGFAKLAKRQNDFESGLRFVESAYDEGIGLLV